MILFAGLKEHKMFLQRMIHLFLYPPALRIPLTFQHGSQKAMGFDE